MLTYTLKNYIKLLHQYCKNNSYTIIFKGELTNFEYKFTITKTSIIMVVNDALMYNVTDISKIKIQDKRLTPITSEEIKYTKEGEVFERVFKNITYISSMYITLFNQMDKRANFTFKHEDKEYCGTYLEGKVLITDITEDSVIVQGTNLNQLNKLFPNYNILYVTEYLNKITYKGYMIEREKLSESLGRKFVKLRTSE